MNPFFSFLKYGEQIETISEANFQTLFNFQKALKAEATKRDFSEGHAL
jgi:hypothetical protein